MDDMRKMMGNMMGNMMGSAMPPMMEKMFSAMPPEQRVEFVNTMMPRCLEIVLDSLDQPGRELLDRAMIDYFTRLAERYLATDATPATPGSEGTTPETTPVQTGTGQDQP